MEMSAEQLYLEREKRIMDAITLKKTDRIPVWANSRLFASERCNVSPEEQMMNLDKMLDANYQETLYFEPDGVEFMPALGAVLSPLDMTQMKWAGRGLPAHSGWQWIEKECMTADEYDELIYDPSDFIVRKYWPRAYDKLGALAKLPPLREAQGYFSAPAAFMTFGTPEGIEALDAIKEAGIAGLKFMGGLKAHGKRLKEAGFPLLWASAVQPPFDLIGDFLRGRTGMMLDMFRKPEKIIQAAEKLLPMAVEAGIRGAKMSGNPRVFIAIHGGVEGFMSVEQYKKFYWPTFRELMVRLIDAGCHPFVLVEGGSTSRLEIMADVPPGKVCYWFENVDMVKAKKVLAGKVCICGNVPLTLLATGTPQQVRDHCKKLIDAMGRDGGYIMGPSGSPDGAKIENVKAMIEFTKEYGA
jgi:hypothetical protein